ncbi:methylthioribulose-1-phosphate dehydratase [Acidihalobacter yilgarnensis]|uniref:Methylthioribulose-1-phosphate dehydratase n=1 Tax=Acidihalobacter yilgarnensis TaxID=2819280 RepID=A0A1D8IQZ7_9GAMM|nr:methylthioribulose 1-phosphate dehydratase [Acidihalobacter yilgarnensis]AOU98919.1 methylthioribulose-1-phosphate dehydratase [Acidihalobacter yilgarnensis]
MSTLETARDTLASLGRDFHARGWVPATAGNLSARLDNGQVAMTRSGRHKGHLGKEDFMRLDTLGQPLDEGTPSAEAGLHLALYRRWPEIGCVLHTHSPRATVISRRRGKHITLSGYELLKAFDGIDTHEAEVALPIFDNDQDIPRLGARVNAWLDRNPAPPGYLIRGHGLYTWGRDAIAAERHAEALEFLFECELLANR